MLFSTTGNTITKNERPQIINPHEGVEIDFYFMAKKMGGSKTQVTFQLWTVIVDAKGFKYGMRTNHMGHFEKWKEMIQLRMREHLLALGVDPLQAQRLIREKEIKKDGHLIPWDYTASGSKIGIDGSDNLYIRRNQFTYL